MEINTERLILRRLQESDREAYFDMMSNPKVMHPIPMPTMSRSESDANFDQYKSADFTLSDKIILAATIKKTRECIGIAAFLFNDEGDPEIGYRLREEFWRVGYGSEIAKAIINYGFQEMNYDIITADTSSTNQGSIKILEKNMRFSHEFWSEKSQCFDRRYVLNFVEWAKNSRTSLLN
jgi:[ribosomal protein S5]-alanine N-acetyltransferase